MNIETFGKIYSPFDPERAAVVELRQRGVNVHYKPKDEVKYTNGV